MPATLLLGLSVLTTPKERPEDLGPAAHAMLLDAVRATDPDLAERLHGPVRPKPWALGALGPGEQAGRWEVRMHVLADTLVPPTLEALSQGQDDVRLGSGRFVVDRIDGFEIPWTSFTDGEVTDVWRFRFHTPVVFRGSSGPDHPPVASILPTPELVFGSLHRRWAKLAPVEIPQEALAACLERTAVIDVNLRSATRLVRTGRDGRRGEMLHGAVGEVTFRLLGTQADPRVLNALAGFAQHAGVGDQTTKGFGVTSLLPRPARGQRRPSSGSARSAAAPRPPSRRRR